MSGRAFITTLVLAMGMLPVVASAAIVQKWQTPGGVSYRLLAEAGYIYEDDTVYKLITGEIVGGTERIALRSGTTGAVIAQTAASTYLANQLWLLDLDSDGKLEIIFWDASGKVVCLNYTVGSSTLAVRFSVVVSANPNTQFAWVDFDGNGQLYLVAMQRTINGGVNVTFAYNIWDRNGVLMTKPALPTTLPPGWTTRLYVDDFDRDEQMELLVGYVPPGGPNPTDLYMLQTSTSVAVEPGITGLPSVELASYPNPTFSVSHINYRVPTSGPASLRLYDLAGREVRTLVNGEVAAGSHKATWDGRDANGRQVPAGAYFLKLNAAGRSSSKRVVRVP